MNPSTAWRWASLSVWAWLAQWGFVAFLAFNPFLAAGILAISIAPAMWLVRGHVPAREDASAGKAAMLAATILVVPLLLAIPTLGRSLFLFFPSTWLHDANQMDNDLFYGILGAVCLGMLTLGLPWVNRWARRGAADVHSVDRIGLLAGLILSLWALSPMLKLSGSFWAMLQLALTIALALHVWRATRGIGWASGAVYVWSILVLTGTLMDGRTVNEWNLAVPLVSFALPAVLVGTIYHLRYQVPTPMLIPLALVACMGIWVALDYTTRPLDWDLTPNANIVAILNLGGLLTPWMVWIAMRPVAEWEKAEAEQGTTSAVAA